MTNESLSFGGDWTFFLFHGGINLRTAITYIMKPNISLTFMTILRMYLFQNGFIKKYEMAYHIEVKKNHNLNKQN